jgi:hypothetical protein
MNGNIFAIFAILIIPVILTRSYLTLSFYNESPRSDSLLVIGVHRGVSKGVEDGRRQPALQADHP